MYFKQKNKTAIKSQHMIADALFSLMKRKSFSKITVTEICEEAAIGRKTFYRNFELREDVIEFKLDMMRREYQEELQLLPVVQRLYYHFAYIQEHADYFILLHQNGFIQLANEKFSVLLPEVMPVWSENPIEQEYRSAYISAGVEAIQRVWIIRGCKESIDEGYRSHSGHRKSRCLFIGKPQFLQKMRTRNRYGIGSAEMVEFIVKIIKRMFKG